ncbi:MAG: amino acid adenylation domain-containing protein, partial [Gammaproteobacteria bacterium]
HNPQCAANANNAAYIIYTSGSTGTPKGVIITHANVTRLMAATQPWFNFDHTDVWTLFHSYAFDFSVWEIWGALLYGGRLVIVPYDVSRDPNAFYALLHQERVTVLNQTPSAFRQLSHAEERIGQKSLALRYIIFGGEALELQSLKPWVERHGDQSPRLINMYGITETTVHVTYRPISTDDIMANAGSVIGQAISDLQVLILDAQRQPTPIGVAGELHIGGAGLARAYLNRPELTAEKFITDPFSENPQARLYKTGDLARYLSDGDIEYLGRLDNQVKLRGFRIELGEIEVVLKQHPRVRDSVVMLREFASGDHRLVAYVVGKQSLAPSHDELRSYLDGKLPDYMVPAAFVWLATLPVTSNGKVDRKALPMPDIARPELASNFVAPRNPVEQSLAQIWSQVLAIDRVGMHDNFFALGGDSILGIHVLAKARQAGLQIDLKQLFQYPTIAGLAAASTRALTIDDEQGLVEGSAPLTPIQHWFFEQNLAALHHWNQAFLFTAPHATDIHALEQALQHLLWHHDALRLRFSSTEHGWQQQLHTGDTVPFTRVDLSALSKQEQASAIEAAAAEQQASLDLARGPLLRAAYFDLGVDQPGRLLIVIHHLVVDGVSWRILMEDLESAYTQLRHNKPVQLPAKTSSFNRWSQRLADYAASDALQNEREYWLAVPGVEDAFLPVDYPARELNTEAFAKTISVVLGAAETEALLHKIPGVYHTQINDALLTALAQAFEKWTNSRRHLLVDLEGHGREELFSDVDLSRTVGWFTTVFPVRLDPGAAIHPGEVLKSIKEQLRSIPQRGIGYGLLRYLSGDPELVRKLRSLPQPEVLFNYLGQFDQVLSGSSLFRFAPEPCGPKHSPQGQRRHLLEIVGQVTDGQLQMNWTYSEKVHRAETIERLAQDFMEALQGLISHCQSVGAGGYTPSDFPLTGLDQAALDQFLTTCTGTGEPDGCKNIEDIYPLSPMQQLFYSINAAQPEVAFEQWHYTLHGKLDAAAFQEAWRQVLARHTVLRTAFFAEGLNAPLQVVYRDVALPWAQHDWRDLPATEQGKQLALFLEADRARGFDLTQVPLLRVTLIRVAEDVYHFLWSTHHLLVDGWSWPLIFKELSACYEALSQDRTASLEPSLPYRDYIAWLARQPVSQAESFWRRILQGCQAPTPLPASVAKSSGAMERFIDQHITLSLESTAALQDFARGHQLTLNTIVQGGWALLLSHYSGTTDVLFGATFSGRPTDLPGVESMVGPCINNLPVRVHVSPETSLVPWLMQLQELQFDYDHYQHTPLVQIQGWSDIPWRFRLFDSLIVFLNYQVDESARRLGHHVTIRHVASPEKTNYPLTLSVMPGQALSLKLIYASTRFESELIQDLLTTLQTLLHGMLADPLAPLTKLLLALPPPPDAAPASVTVTPRQYQAPQTELQQVIAAVWQQAFGVTQVSLQDNFFDLGGHSLLMVRVHSQLQEMLNIQLPIVKMFQYPTISALAGYLHQDLEEQPSYNAVYARAQKQKQAQARHPRHGKILRKP